MTIWRICLFIIFMWPFDVWAEPLRLLVFGDSLASGYGLAQSDGFSPSLERQLNKLGLDVEVINAGVAGDTSFSALARSQFTLQTPHDAVILEIGANDMLRATPPAMIRQNLTKLMEEIEAPVFLIGIRANPSYGRIYQNAFDRIYPDLAEEYETGFYPFIMEVIFKDGLAKSVRYFQADRLHLNPDGVELVTSDLAPNLRDWIEKNFEEDRFKP